MLLERVDEELVKCGLVPSTQHAHTSADTRRVEVGPDAGVRAVGEPVGGVMD